MRPLYLLISSTNKLRKNLKRHGKERRNVTINLLLYNTYGITVTVTP